MNNSINEIEFDCENYESFVKLIGRDLTEKEEKMIMVFSNSMPIDYFKEANLISIKENAYREIVNLNKNNPKEFNEMEDSHWLELLKELYSKL